MSRKKSLMTVMSEITDFLNKHITGPPMPCSDNFCSTFSKDSTELKNMLCRKSNKGNYIPDDSCRLKKATFYLVKAVEHELEKWAESINNSKNEYTVTASVSPTSICRVANKACGKEWKNSSSPYYQALLGINIDYSAMSDFMRNNITRDHIYKIYYDDQGKIKKAELKQ